MNHFPIEINNKWYVQFDGVIFTDEFGKDLNFINEETASSWCEARDAICIAFMEREPTRKEKSDAYWAQRQAIHEMAQRDNYYQGRG